MFTVPSNFIGTFKTGDNINHNLSVLRLLYEQYNASDDLNRKLLRRSDGATVPNCILDGHGPVRE